MGLLAWLLHDIIMSSHIGDMGSYFLSAVLGPGSYLTFFFKQASVEY